MGNLKLKESSKEGFKEANKTFMQSLVFTNSNSICVLGHIFFIWIPIIFGGMFIYLSKELGKKILTVFAIFLLIYGIIMLIITIIANIKYHFEFEETK